MSADEDWRTKWDPKAMAARTAPPAPPPVVLAPDGGTPYGRKALASELEQVRTATVGSRNGTLNDAAFAIGQLTGGNELPASMDVVDALEAAGLACGLEPAEVRRTVASGLNAGILKPRSAPARMSPNGDMANVDPNTGEIHDEDDDAGHPFADLGWALHGDPPERAVPTVCRRPDGIGLFYPAAVNWLYGVPESGKTWIALAAVVEALNDGGTAVYIDADHNGQAEIVGRLIALGADRAALADPARFGYLEPDDQRDIRAAVKAMKAMAPGVAVLDSAGELIPMHGGESVNNDHIANWNRAVPGPLKDAGWAVIVLDHLTKNGDDEYPVGAGAKKRLVGGSMIAAKPRKPLAPGLVGEVDLFIRKDRPGSLRSAGNPERAGRFVLDSSQDRPTTLIELPPSGPFVPTAVMAKVSKVLEDRALAGEAHMGQRAIREAVGGKNNTAVLAIRLLTAGGYIASDRHGTRSLRPYREGSPLATGEVAGDD